MGAYANIAALDEEAGNFDQAAKGYQKASEQALDDETKSRYLYFSALAIEAGGKKEEAGKKYQELLKLYDKTSFATQAKVGLLRLGIEIE
jgi:tetratricopeptide (TPR) repeat protein